MGARLSQKTVFIHGILLPALFRRDLAVKKAARAENRKGRVGLGDLPKIMPTELAL